MPYEVPLYVIARITKSNAVTFEGTAEIVDENGALLSRASGLYMKLPISTISPHSDHTIKPEDIDVIVPDNITDITIKAH